MTGSSKPDEANMTIQSARSRVEAATAGEWRFSPWHISAVRAGPHGHVIANTASDADAELIAFAVNTLKRLLSEEGQEVMARALVEHAYAERGQTLTARDWSDLREGCIGGMQAAISAILGTCI